MPKGVKASKAKTAARVLDRIQLELVPPGACVYPLSQCEEYPDGIPLPDGIRIRSKSAVEMRFCYLGKRVSETLRAQPTVAMVRAAGDKLQRVTTLAALGKFGEAEYLEEFPNSKRFDRNSEKQASDLPDVMTVGRALDDWLTTSWGGHSPNSRRDYVRVIRNQLKPMVLGLVELPDSAFVAGVHSGAQPPAAGFTSGEMKGRSGGQFASTSTLPAELVTEDVLLEEGEAPSGRRRRRIRAWAKGAESSAVKPHPASTKSVTRYRPVELPLRCLAQLRVSELSDLVASTLRTSLREGGMSVKRVNNVLSPLRQALDRLVEQRILASSPFQSLKPLTRSEVNGSDFQSRWVDSEVLDDSDVALDAVDDSSSSRDFDVDDEPDPLNHDEMLAVLAELDEPMRNFYTFAFHSGLRTGELIGLRLKDIDWSGNRVRVRRSVSRGILKKPKSSKGRWVDLLPPARDALAAHIALLNAPGGWVFPNPVTGQRWANESKLTKRWRAALAKAKVRYRRPYHTRHTYASMMLSSGEPLLYVAAQLGHSDWKMVQDRYARWLPSANGRKAGSAVAEASRANWARIADLTKPS